MRGITKQTFQDADEKTRFGILFDYQIGMTEDIKKIKELLEKHPHGCEERLSKLENGKLKDTVVSGGLGFIGGFTAMAAKLKFWG